MATAASATAQRAERWRAIGRYVVWPGAQREKTPRPLANRTIGVISELQTHVQTASRVYGGAVLRRSGLLSALAVAVALIAIPASASAEPYARLSDERTWTRSAFVDFATPVRAAPKVGAAKVAELRPQTFHGRPEVVLVLGSREVDGRIWLRIRYPGLGRRIGWVTPRAGGRLDGDAIGERHEVAGERLGFGAWGQITLVDGAAGIGRAACSTPACASPRAGRGSLSGVPGGEGALDAEAAGGAPGAGADLDGAVQEGGGHARAVGSVRAARVGGRPSV